MHRVRVLTRNSCWGDDFIVPYDGLRGIHNALSITHVKVLRLTYEDFRSVRMFVYYTTP
jgi:hypothetical protein